MLGSFWAARALGGSHPSDDSYKAQSDPRQPDVTLQQCSDISHIPSATMEALASARRPVDLFTRPCQEIAVYSGNLARNGEKRKRAAVAFLREPPTFAEASVKRARHKSAFFVVI